MAVVPIILNLGLAWWIYSDATRLGVREGMVPGAFDMSPAKWALGTVFLGVIWLFVYLSKRDRFVALAAQRRAIEAAGEARPSDPPERDRAEAQRRRAERRAQRRAKRRRS